MSETKAEAKLTSQAGVRDEVGETHCECEGVKVGRKKKLRGGEENKVGEG
jgi:hypothetical protein